MASAKPVAETKKIESKPVVENKAPADTPGKSRKFLILICAVVLVIAAGGASFFVLPAFKGARAALGKKFASSEEKKEVVKGTMALEPFLVNLADTEEVRFVKTTFQLGLAEEMKEGSKSSVAVPAIRDSIISLLSSKKAEQILTPEGKETLRKEIKSRVNTISPEMKVLEVYIVDFVVQL
jgi:flagellar protein FliL